MLAVFAISLNQWVNLRSLLVVSKVAGWDWALPVQWPLFFLVTAPLRLLPGGIQPIALNLFSAGCGALALALLARSVALLPHDRTHEQRIRERSDFSLLSVPLAWVPPALAVLVCGLQLTFWETATALTGESLNILLFAYVIRCLLEFRVSQRESWLTRMAFVYGLAITNDWSFVGFFPLLLIALIWIRGLAFFRLGFLTSMVLAGLAGLSLYFFLPIWWVVSGQAEYGLIDVLRANLAAQKQFLVDTPVLRNRAAILSLTSLLPVLLIGIRWPSSFGDTSAAGANITIIMFRVVHLFFLAACLFVAFDPKFSPRALGYGLPFLSFYYLGALAIGYYSGYALLTFTDPPKKSYRRQADVMRLVNPLVRGVVLLALVAVPIGLAYRNFGMVRLQNGNLLKSLAEDISKELPGQPAYLLSEDPLQILLLEGYHRTQGQPHNHVLINTRSLELPSYHEQLSRHYGARWPRVLREDQGTARVEQVVLQQMAADLAASNSVYYLQPSFGYFFEKLYAVPQGNIFSLHLYATNQVFPPPLTPQQIQANDANWSTVPDYVNAAKVAGARGVMDGVYVANYFARGFNTWGVNVQQRGDLKAAAQFFQRAFEFNTNNAPAFLNGKFNADLQAGRPRKLISPKELEEQFGQMGSIDSLLSTHGPFDQPQFCEWLGNLFITQSLFRQAIQQFSQVTKFEPTNFVARLGIAKAYVYGNWVDEGLRKIEAIRQDIQPLAVTNQIDLINLEAAAYYAKDDFTKAEKLLITARDTFPDLPSVQQSLYELYRASSRWTNALALLESQLTRQPTNRVMLLQKAETQMALDDLGGASQTLDKLLAAAPRETAALLYKAFIALQQKQYEAGVAIADRVLQYDLDNPQALTYRGIMRMELKDYDRAQADFDRVLKADAGQMAALRNRALLFLRANRLKEARADYLKLQKAMPTAYAVYYGLGEIAYQQKDAEETVEYYRKYLRYVPAQATPELEQEKKQVQTRLEEMQAKIK